MLQNYPYPCAAALAAILAPVTFGISLVSAQAPPSGIIEKDNREIIDSWDHPWSAIGKIFTPKFSAVDACTATLVAPRLVVTAAHCLFDSVSKKPIQPSAIHFVAGFRREKHLGHSLAECVSFNADYDFGKKLSLESVETDYAFVVLKKEFSVKPVPIFKKDQLTKTDRLIHAGYGRDRKFVLSAHKGCHVRYRQRNAYLSDCDTMKGASGGPILIRNSDDYYIAGVMAAAGVYNTPEGEKLFNSFAGITRDRQNLRHLASCK
ncbi:MAG: trypsin-like serine peptidase [Hyphomicrobiales bacterium]